MDRRTFLSGAAGFSAAAGALADVRDSRYRIVTPFAPGSPKSGMPGRYPGRVVSVHSARVIDESTERVDVPTVKEMISRGMTTLTGDRDARDSWARFFDSGDVVGIKVNCSGAPGAMSMPDVVAEIARNLMVVGVKANNIVVHERNRNQMNDAGYERVVPAGVQVKAAGDTMGYDPRTYVECTFFGEDDTRSNMVRMVTERFTKIINVPNMKDHSASGVTGCLKNIAYGEFNNVARSHYQEKTETLTFIGTLAMVEPLRSRTVLNIMDGIRGVWHGGPFSPTRKFRFYPKQMKFGTDPVAMDRLLIDVIDSKRKAEGVTSVFERSPKYYDQRKWATDANFNRFVREPGHIEFAGKLGLGVYDIAKIQHSEIRL
jgi:uncharacterized protein (DUF362 family)